MGFHTKPTTFVGHVKVKVENLVTNLKEIGAEVVKENNHFITFDPSGNTIELAV